MYAGQTISYVILRQHDLFDPCEVLWLILFHPEDLRRGKSGERNIRSVLRQLLFADHIIQIIAFLCGSAIVPEDGRADHLILLIQNDQSMHLSSEANACHLALVRIFQKLPDALHSLFIPVLRLLFRPAGMWEIQRVFPGYNIPDVPFTVH